MNACLEGSEGSEDGHFGCGFSRFPSETSHFRPFSRGALRSPSQVGGVRPRRRRNAGDHHGGLKPPREADALRGRHLPQPHAARAMGFDTSPDRCGVGSRNLACIGALGPRGLRNLRFWGVSEVRHARGLHASLGLHRDETLLELAAGAARDASFRGVWGCLRSRKVLKSRQSRAKRCHGDGPNMSQEQGTPYFSFKPRRYSLRIINSGPRLLERWALAQWFP